MARVTLKIQPPSASNGCRIISQIKARCHRGSRECQNVECQACDHSGQERKAMMLAVQGVGAADQLFIRGLAVHGQPHLGGEILRESLDGREPQIPIKTFRRLGLELNLAGFKRLSILVDRIN